MMILKMLPAALAVCLLVSGEAQAADAAKGKRVFNKCKACHVADGPKNKIGPTLQGMFGRKAGTVEGFNYSDAMVAAGNDGLIWNEETLDAYLKKPREAIPGNKMLFVGLKKKKDRDNLIAWLKEKTAE